MALLTNLSSKSVNNVLTTADFNPTGDKGSSCDFIVRSGVINGLEPQVTVNGVLVGGGTGEITPSTFDETTETNTPDNQSPTAGDVHGSEAVSENVVRAPEANRVAGAAYVNGQTVKYVCVVTSAGDLVAYLIT